MGTASPRAAPAGVVLERVFGDRPVFEALHVPPEDGVTPLIG
jgi:hypothetical protein